MSRQDDCECDYCVEFRKRLAEAIAMEYILEELVKYEAWEKK